MRMNGMKAFGSLKSCTGCLLLFMACSSLMQPTASPTPSATAKGTIYGASPAGPSGASAIFRLNNPSSLNGNIVPSATITGPLTLLDSPVISLDASADRLFALVNMDSPLGMILVFDHASTRNGDVFPGRVIAGNATGIQGKGVFAVDSTRNRLYAGTRVAVNGSVNILVFKNAGAASGNVPPDAILQFSSSPTFPVSLVLDQVNDRLFIGDSSQNIRVFDHASMLTAGPMVPNRTISDPNNILSGGMALDSAGRLLVSSRNSTNPAHISIYANAATANGVVSPVAIITGPATALNIGGPGALAVFNGPGASAGGDLYVSVESGKVLVFTNIATANGDMKPARTICISTQASGLSLAADGSH
jgi:hypothetical protein